MPRGGHNRRTIAAKAAAGTLDVWRERQQREKAAAAAKLQSKHGTKVPPPPKGTPARVRAAWLDLAKQVDAVGSYTAQAASAFHALVVLTAESPTPAPRPRHSPASSPSRPGTWPVSNSTRRPGSAVRWPRWARRGRRSCAALPPRRGGALRRAAAHPRDRGPGLHQAFAVLLRQAFSGPFPRITRWHPARLGDHRAVSPTKWCGIFGRPTA